MKIIEFDSLPSTQDEIKKYADESEDVAVVAACQTKGRGTKGRSFSSENGGLFVSFLFRHEHLPAEKAFTLVMDYSLAVTETLRAFGVDADIKWPNDVIARGKKICGMLIENHVDNGLIARSFVGIGINLNNDFPPELESVAISAKQILGKRTEKSAFLSELIKNLYRRYPADLYKRRSAILGRPILVIRGKETFEAVAKNVLEDGRLLLEGGDILSSEEVSVRS